MTRTKARGCEGKVRHNTRKEAMGHLWSMVHRGASLQRLNVYRCKHCGGGWHVGHRPGSRSR